MSFISFAFNRTVGRPVLYPAIADKIADGLGSDDKERAVIHKVTSVVCGIAAAAITADIVGALDVIDHVTTMADTLDTADHVSSAADVAGVDPDPSSADVHFGSDTPPPYTDPDTGAPLPGPSGANGDITNPHTGVVTHTQPGTTVTAPGHAPSS